MRALWVEDEPRTLLHERITLRNLGWNVTHVSTAEDALAQLRDTAFDIVLLDFILAVDRYRDQRGHVDPDVGLSLLRSIRSLGPDSKTQPNVIVLAISAVVSADRRNEALRFLESDRFLLVKSMYTNRVFDTLAQEITARFRTPDSH